MTSYFLFIKTERTKIQAENPSASVTDITKMCGQRWREIDATGKQEYETQAADDKLRYAKEQQEWQVESVAPNTRSAVQRSCPSRS